MKKYVDEVVIIESGSTDTTLDIAREYTDQIFFREWDNHYGNQRNFGLSKCHGQWVFLLDSDEFVGENFGKVVSLLNNRYRTIAIPRYQIINLAKMLQITTRPHWFDWQTRLIKNDGTIRYEDKPVHEALANYRPRLRCNLANIFHLDFVVNDYSSRQQKVNYYERQYPGAGYPRMYLFEDFPYKTACVLEMPEPHVLELLRQNKEFLSYPDHSSIMTELQQKFQYHTRSLLTKARSAWGI
ncbi:glycosyl transferase, group 2 family protein [Acetonema longum DSM 6540]|uniref:Glycosyl transferase, group 2 family protein n=1 Tax=Acetonema longum DSM 6540 TaxID=1009370 RepID=F7NLY2_9FIRM|nr:glycosyl transferase, group 2 family protein [Acetonema longum DSM 6540]